MQFQNYTELADRLLEFYVPFKDSDDKTYIDSSHLVIFLLAGADPRIINTQQVNGTYSHTINYKGSDLTTVTQNLLFSPIVPDTKDYKRYISVNSKQPMKFPPTVPRLYN